MNAGIGRSGTEEGVVLVGVGGLRSWGGLDELHPAGLLVLPGKEPGPLHRPVFNAIDGGERVRPSVPQKVPSRRAHSLSRALIRSKHPSSIQKKRINSWEKREFFFVETTIQ